VVPGHLPVQPLRRRFDSTSAEVGATVATDGGYVAGRADATKLLIADGKRTSLNLRVDGNSPLYESERDIGLNPAATGADPRAFRTLVGAAQSARLTATANRKILGNVGATVTAEAGRLENRDHTQGFLDYNQRRAALAVEWEHGAWHATVRTEARRLDYLVQKVGVGTDRPARIADAYDLSARLERDLGHNWSVFVENRWERTRSNVVDDSGAHPFSYRTNMASAGVQRTF
jgi:hypothetical protein